MIYKLFFENHEIGTVTQEDSDFPNLWGTYELHGQKLDEINRLKEYVEYSIRGAELMETDKEKFNELMESEEDHFMDLIESEEWKLIDNETGETYKILIPNFTSSTELTWRWSI